MGTEAVWVPAVIAAVGAGASYYNTQKTAKKQDSALAGKLRNQRKTQDEIDSKVTDLVRKTGESDPNAARSSAEAGFLDMLKKGRGQTNSGLTNVAGASDAYQNDTTNAASGLADFGKGLAGLMSRIDAPGIQRRQEGVLAQRFGNETDMLRRQAGGDAFLDDLRLSGIRRNPWIDAAAQAMQSYGSSGGNLGISGSGAASGAAGAPQVAPSRSRGSIFDYGSGQRVA